MGYIAHHAIIVTGYNSNEVQNLHTLARQLFAECAAHVTVIAPLAQNGYLSFAVLPDGSKEGWDQSNSGDEARNAFCTACTKLRENGIDFIEVRFGGDDKDLRSIVRASTDKAPTDLGETQHVWVYTDGSWTCDACGYVVHCYRLPATLAHPCTPKTKEKP